MIIDQQLIEQRLQELETEMAKGQQQLSALEQRRSDLQNTLLRLSGAYQVLTEILETDGQPETQRVSAGLAAAG